MRIRDLIPDRDALISPDFYRRKNLLVQVIEDDERVRTARRDRRATATASSARPRPRRHRATGARPMRDAAAPSRAAAIGAGTTASRRIGDRTCAATERPIARTAADGSERSASREDRAVVDRAQRSAGRAVRRAELGLRDDRAAQRPT